MFRETDQKRLGLKTSHELRESFLGGQESKDPHCIPAAQWSLPFFLFFLAGLPLTQPTQKKSDAAEVLCLSFLQSSLLVPDPHALPWFGVELRVVLEGFDYSRSCLT